MNEWDDLIACVDDVDNKITNAITNRELVMVCVDSRYYAINAVNGDVLINNLRYEDMTVVLLNHCATVDDVHYSDSLVGARRWAMSKVPDPRHVVRWISSPYDRNCPKG